MANRYLTGLLLPAILLIACSKAHQRDFRQTEEIKKYGLVFRLQEYRQRIDYLEKRGLADRAELEKSKIDQYNRNLVQDFQKEFDFCPVRFYYSGQSDELKAGKRVLLNNNMEPDTSIPLPEKVILANYALGKQVENIVQRKAFRVEGMSIVIPTRYYLSGEERPLEAKDVRKINKKLHKMNKPRG